MRLDQIRFFAIHLSEVTPAMGKNRAERGQEARRATGCSPFFMAKSPVRGYN